MNRSLEGLPLAELKETINGLHSTLIDKNYLHANTPHLFNLMIHFINQGYFDKFKKNQHINILEIGCNCAPLVLLLENLKKALYTRGIDIHFNYLGIDILQSLIQDLQREFKGHKGISFSAIDASKAELVNYAMIKAKMSSADIVLIKRPVVVGLGWSKWIFPGTFVLTILLCLSRLDPRQGINPISEIKNFIYTIILATIFDQITPIISRQYTAFLQILSGLTAQHFQEAMVITTHYYPFEALASNRIIHMSYPGEINSGLIPFLSNTTPSLYLENYYNLIENYQYQPTNPLMYLEAYINNEFMAAIIMSFAIQNVLKNKSIPHALLKVMLISFLQMCLPPTLELIYLFLPKMMTIIKGLAIFGIANTRPKSHSLLLMLGLILINLPSAGAIAYSPPSEPGVATASPSISIAALLIYGMSKVEKWITNKFQAATVGASAMPKDSTSKQNQNRMQIMSEKLQTLSTQAKSLPSNRRAEYQFILAEHLDTLTEIKAKPSITQITELEGDLIACQEDLENDLLEITKNYGRNRLFKPASEKIITTSTAIPYSLG